MNNKLQEITTALTEHREALCQSVQDLSQAQLDFHPDSDNWSIGEILNHLAIVEGFITQLGGNLLQKAVEMGLGADTSNDSVIHCLDQFEIERPKERANAPAPVLPKAGNPKAELLAALGNTRKGLLDIMEKASNYDLKQLIAPHPFLGDFNLYQWFLLVGKHEQRHTGQIAKVKATTGFPQ